jgi:carbamate kinase
MNPYILQGQPMQDLGGLSPVFQNFGQQQANQQAALAQQNQLVNQAGQTQSGSMNPMAMAAMLRKKDPNKPAPVYDKSEIMPDMPQYADPAYMQAGY